MAVAMLDPTPVGECQYSTQSYGWQVLNRPWRTQCQKVPSQEDAGNGVESNVGPDVELEFWWDDEMAVVGDNAPVEDGYQHLEWCGA